MALKDCTAHSSCAWIPFQDYAIAVRAEAHDCPYLFGRELLDKPAHA